MRRLAIAASLGVAAASLGDAPARADGTDAGTRTTMTCERASGPGRVRCEVEARVEAGETIAWGDVVLLRLPTFATALRGRVGPHDAAVREPGAWRWTFALVARAAGTGQVEGRVRIVVCNGSVCAPRTIDVTGQLAVE
jgi:hypothetical protein